MQGRLVYLFLIVLTLLLALISLLIGQVYIPPEQVLNLLFGGDTDQRGWSYIVEDRLSQTLMAAVAGSGLALSGLVMQTIFRNPLAGPGVLGVSAGASIGAAVFLLFPLSLTGVLASVGLVSASIAGALLVLLLILWVSRVFADSSTVLITGLMVTFFASAGVGVLLQHSNMAQIQRYVMWGMGSTAGVPLPTVYIIALTVFVVAAILWVLSRRLDLLLLGDDHAQISGVSVNVSRRWMILLCGILVAILTAYTGPIGFIGIAVPHIIRILGIKGLHRNWIPACAIMGAALLMLSDILSRFPIMLPLNAVTSIIGAPLVIWILIRQRKKEGQWN